MPEAIVRFSEAQRYDINQDCDVTRFVATTPKGSYHVEIPTVSSKNLREKRSRFKERVMELIQSDLDPCEVILDETH